MGSFLRRLRGTASGSPRSHHDDVSVKPSEPTASENPPVRSLTDSPAAPCPPQSPPPVPHRPFLIWFGRLCEHILKQWKLHRCLSVTVSHGGKTTFFFFFFFTNGAELSEIKTPVMDFPRPQLFLRVKVKCVFICPPAPPRESHSLYPRLQAILSFSKRLRCNPPFTVSKPIFFQDLLLAARLSPRQ